MRMLQRVAFRERGRERVRVMPDRGGGDAIEKRFAPQCRVVSQMRLEHVCLRAMMTRGQLDLQSESATASPAECDPHQMCGGTYNFPTAVAPRELLDIIAAACSQRLCELGSQVSVPCRCKVLHAAARARGMAGLYDDTFVEQLRQGLGDITHKWGLAPALQRHDVEPVGKRHLQGCRSGYRPSADLARASAGLSPPRRDRIRTRLDSKLSGASASLRRRSRSPRKPVTTSPRCMPRAPSATWSPSNS